MIRLGIVDFDTSHAVEFTKRLNTWRSPRTSGSRGRRSSPGVPGRSEVAPEVIPKNLETLKGYGVEILDDPAALFGKVDAVLIEAVDGSVHLARAMPFLEKGMPTYVDKPFTCSLADAKALMKVAMEKHVPMMSASSLRYAPEVVAASGGQGPLGAIVGASTFGPGMLHPRNPGMFHYGIHAVEMLFTLMGPGCKRVSCQSEPGAEVATGVWSDGRVASVRCLRAGKHDYGFTVFGEKGVKAEGVGSKYIYRELLKKVVGMFETREIPIDPRETLEIVAFIEAAPPEQPGRRGAGRDPGLREARSPLGLLDPAEEEDRPRPAVRIRKRNGWSARNWTGLVGRMAMLFIMTTAVAAAASVPSSLTSANALWITAERNSLRSVAIPEKSAPAWKAVGIPSLERGVVSSVPASILNRGKAISTLRPSNFSRHPSSVSGVSDASSAARPSSFFGSRRTIDNSWPT